MTAAPLPDWLHRRAATHAATTALVAGDVRWTFADLDARADDGARRLAAAGVAPGERVGLLARNGAAFAVTVHAAGRRGAALVPLNVRLTPPEIAQQVADAGVRRLYADEANAPLAERVAALAPGLALERLGPHGPAGAADPAAERREAIDPDALHSIIFTSGTTGSAKGALLTWGNLWWSAVGAALHLGHHRDDCWLATMPLFHVGGLSILMRSVIYGIPVIVHDGFDPVRANAAIDEQGVTIVSVVAVMLQRMLDARGDRPYPPALRCVMAGGGPVPQPLLERAQRAGVPVALTYGLTETASQVATAMPGDVPAKLGSVGRPLLPMEIRVERDGAIAPPGEVGEIVVRGPSVVRGYVGRPEATAESWRGGWFHTGDLGYLDADGDLYVVDRRDDLIVSGGENVYPAEIEAVLHDHPAVAEAAVIGVDDERWGRVPFAIVRRRDGAALREDELLAFAAERLARYKVPRAVRWSADELPRNAAGKLLRRRLAKDG